MSAKTRKEEYAEATRAALVDVARGLFAERGYAGVSIDEIVQGARVTKGALYHHFADKQALFREVLETIERDIAARMTERAVKERAPWDQLGEAGAGQRAAGLARH